MAAGAAAAVAAAEGDANYGQTQPSARQVPPVVRQRRGFWRLLRANLFDLTQLVRQSWFTLLLFALVVAAGTAYHYAHTPTGQRATVPASLYDTLQLIIFQQTSQQFPADALGQSLYFLLPVLGLLVLVQGVLNFGRRVLDKGSRLEAWQVSLATTFRGHVIVCGLGRLGWRVVTRLIEAGYEVVVVEQDFRSQFTARALEAGVPVITGDARERGTLRQAGIQRARGVIANVNGDQTNVEIALAARTIRSSIRVVLRAFSEELGNNLDKIFGEDSAFSHSALAAPTIAAATISRDIVYAFPIENELLAVTDVTVLHDTELVGSAASDLESVHDVRVLDRQRGRGSASGRAASAALLAGERVTLLGTLPALESVRLRNVVAGQVVPLQHPTGAYDTVLVCGLGKVGSRVTRLLAQVSPGLRIVAIYRPGDASTLVAGVAGMSNVTLVEGDATDVDVLRRAGLERAYAVAAVTSDDLVNLQVGLAARGARQDVHVVMRVFSDALAEELNHVYEIHTTYSTSNIASPTLAAAAVLASAQGGWVDRGFTVGGKLFSSDEFEARPDGILTGSTVGEIRARYGMLILAVTEGRTRVLPPLDARIAAGDRGVYVGQLEAITKIRARLDASR